MESKALRELMFRFLTIIVRSSSGKAPKMPREGGEEEGEEGEDGSTDDGGEGSGGARTGRRASYFRL